MHVFYNSAALMSIIIQGDNACQREPAAPSGPEQRTEQDKPPEKRRRGAHIPFSPSISAVSRPLTAAAMYHRVS